MQDMKDGMETRMQAVENINGHVAMDM